MQVDSWTFGNGENSEQTEEDEVIPPSQLKGMVDEKFSKQIIMVKSFPKKDYDQKKTHYFSFEKAMEQHYLELQEEEERRDSS